MVPLVSEARTKLKPKKETTAKDKKIKIFEINKSVTKDFFLKYISVSLYYTVSHLKSQSLQDPPEQYFFDG